MPEGRLTLLVGGARSGKSAHAERLVREQPAPWTYIATAQAFDAEMEERIAHHRARRDEARDGGAAGRWLTVDAPHHLAAAVAAVPDGCPLLVDCLTLWLSNRMLAQADVEAEGDALAALLSRPRGPWFAVSNEVGLGIVPDTPLGRRFRDAQGRLNQKLAAAADTVLLMVAGIPMKVK